MFFYAGGTNMTDAVFDPYFDDTVMVASATVFLAFYTLYQIDIFLATLFTIGFVRVFTFFRFLT